MKFLIFALALACANARPDVSHIVRSSEADAPVLRSDFDISPDGQFAYAYETGNGIAAQATGKLKIVNNEYPSIEVEGSFRYTSPEGEPVETSYIANEYGFQAQGSHIPTPPPVPEYIIRALRYIEEHQPIANNFQNYEPGRV